MNKKFPIIRGFNKSSEAGIDIFAPSIFLGGCNFRCPYCMNSKLALNTYEKNIDIKTVKDFVMNDESEFIMISGGEPLCTDINILINLLEEIKSWGCKIGMSTNGSKNEELKNITKYLNYVAMDIKSPYSEIYAEINGDIIEVLKSRSFLAEEKNKRSDFDYELRTTLYPLYIGIKEIREMGGIIKPDDKWVLQQFRIAKNMLNSNNSENPYDVKTIEKLLKEAKQFTKNVILRYV